MRLLWAQLQLTDCNLGLVTSLTLGYFLSKGRLLDSAGLPVPISEDIILRPGSIKELLTEFWADFSSQLCSLPRNWGRSGGPRTRWSSMRWVIVGKPSSVQHFPLLFFIRSSRRPWDVGKEWFFPQTMLGQLDIHLERNEAVPLLHTTYKN